MTRETTAKTAAENILNDRKGANYYHDLKILSDYLKGALGISKEKANHIAKMIHKDREGADYYRNFEILSNVLENVIDS